MAKLNSKKLIRLIENLIEKKIDAELEKRVDERVKELLPMLTEHEVNRLLREKINEDVGTNTPVKSSNNSTGNRIADEVIDESNLDDERLRLRERFTRLIGADVERDSGGNKAITMTSNDVSRGSVPTRGGKTDIPTTTHHGEPIDVSDPNVQAVANVLNQDFSGKLKDMEARSKKRGGKITTNVPAGGG